MPPAPKDSRFEPLSGDRLFTALLYENASTAPPIFTGFLNRGEFLEDR